MVSMAIESAYRMASLRMIASEFCPRLVQSTSILCFQFCSHECGKSSCSFMASYLFLLNIFYAQTVPALNISSSRTLKSFEDTPSVAGTARSVVQRDIEVSSAPNDTGGFHENTNLSLPSGLPTLDAGLNYECSAELYGSPTPDACAGAYEMLGSGIERMTFGDRQNEAAYDFQLPWRVINRG